MPDVLGLWPPRMVENIVTAPRRILLVLAVAAGLFAAVVAGVMWLIHEEVVSA